MSVITFGRDDHTKLTKNFERYEFQCPCGCGSQMVDVDSDMDASYDRYDHPHE